MKKLATFLVTLGAGLTLCGGIVQARDHNWRYDPPTAYELHVEYPRWVGQNPGNANHANIRIEDANSNRQRTLNFHTGSRRGFYPSHTFVFQSHRDWPGYSEWCVTWVQVAETNYHWQGRVCHEDPPPTTTTTTTVPPTTTTTTVPPTTTTTTTVPPTTTTTTVPPTTTTTTTVPPTTTTTTVPPVTTTVPPVTTTVPPVTTTVPPVTTTVPPVTTTVPPVTTTVPPVTTTVPETTTTVPETTTTVPETTTTVPETTTTVPETDCDNPDGCLPKTGAGMWLITLGLSTIAAGIGMRWLARR